MHRRRSVADSTVPSGQVAACATLRVIGILAIALDVEALVRAAVAQAGPSRSAALGRERDARDGRRVCRRRCARERTDRRRRRRRRVGRRRWRHPQPVAAAAGGSQLGREHVQRLALVADEATEGEVGARAALGEGIGVIAGHRRERVAKGAAQLRIRAPVEHGASKTKGRSGRRRRRRADTRRNRRRRLRELVGHGAEDARGALAVAAVRRVRVGAHVAALLVAAWSAAARARLGRWRRRPAHRLVAERVGGGGGGVGAAGLGARSAVFAVATERAAAVARARSAVVAPAILTEHAARAAHLQGKARQGKARQGMSCLVLYYRTALPCLHTCSLLSVQVEPAMREPQSSQSVP